MLIIFGKEYKTLYEVVKTYNIKYDTLQEKINRGESIEKILLDNLRTFDNQPLIIGGKQFKNISEACRYYNITKKKYTIRVLRGMTVEEALKTPIIKKHKTVIALGKEYKSMNQCLKAYNMSKVYVDKRLSNGMTLDEVIQEKMLSDKQKDRLIAFGKKYKSIAECARENGIGKKFISYRLKQGTTLEEAIINFKLTKKRLSDKLYRCKCKKCGESFIATEEMCIEHFKNCFSYSADIGG